MHDTPPGPVGSPVVDGIGTPLDVAAGLGGSSGVPQARVGGENGAAEAPDVGESAVEFDVEEATGNRDAGSAEPDVTSTALLDPERVLVATAWQTPIYRKPDFDSARIGFLRSGSVVSRSPEPKGYGGCARGFYEIEPRGFVCVGKSATIDASALVATAVDRRADRSAALPYRYAEAGPVPPQRYTGLVKLGVGTGAFDELRSGAPEFLRDGALSLRSNGARREGTPQALGPVVARSSFALVDAFEVDGDGWGLTSDLMLLPLRGLKPVEPSRFKGVRIAKDVLTPEPGEDDIHDVVHDVRSLPLGFVMERHAQLFAGTPETGLVRQRPLQYREAVSLTGKRARIGGQYYLETLEGHWLNEAVKTVRVEARSTPHWAKPGRTWIDVSIANQTLVAYVGAEPVFATLVSTGRDGLGDPETTQSTILGEFLIHTKHVTDAMSSDEEGDVYDHQDVPYVQFFKDGYALHAAYWHDAFGSPRSHGCINLSPLDAQFLFEWSDPRVPETWHTAMSLLDGTLISIRP